MNGKTAKRIRKAVKKANNGLLDTSVYNRTKDAWKRRAGGHKNHTIEVAQVRA